MVAAGVNFGAGESRTGVDLAEDLLELKRERNAVILAHNYQVPELQDIADFVGDSLGLSYQAAKTDADVILFCGVHFMAETAKIINPSKCVILPDLDAGCSLSESCPPEKLAQFLKDHADKNYYVIAYINCSAGVKALSDVICTSGNAEKIVRAAPADRNILFVPDQNLGAWVMERTGRKMDLWQGNCYVHIEFTARSIGKIREEYPDAPLVAHPECTYAVRMLADEVCSTEKMVTFCKESPAQRNHRRYRSRHAASIAKRNSRQNFYSRADGTLRVRGMPVHENEHIGEGVRCVAAYAARNRFARSTAQTRGSANSAHAGIEQVIVAAVCDRRTSRRKVCDGHRPPLQPGKSFHLSRSTGHL